MVYRLLDFMVDAVAAVIGVDLAAAKPQARRNGPSVERSTTTPPRE